MTYLPFPQVHTVPIGNGHVMVTEDYTYENVTVHNGFISDLASIPRILWWLYPPYNPDYKTACVVHDLLCKNEEYAKADRYFEQILKASGVKYTTRRNLVMGVKLWHKLAYTADNSPRWWLKIITKET